MKNLSVCYINGLRRLMKLDKHCRASEMFVHYDIPAFDGNILQILSIVFSPVQIVLLSVLFYFLFRCLLLPGATGLILYTLTNDIL